MNSLRLNSEALNAARKQFCLDIGMPWEEYQENPRQKVYIRKASYKEGTCLVDAEGARVYEGRNDFFHAIICLGQLFLVVDEKIYDWAAEKFSEYPPEWFCEFENLRMIDEKLREFGHQIKDTHVYMLPEAECENNDNKAAGDLCSPQGLEDNDVAGGLCGQQEPAAAEEVVKQNMLLDGEIYIWYNQEEILQFRDYNRFGSAICFSQTQPDMLAVAALKQGVKMRKSKVEECVDAFVEMTQDICPAVERGPAQASRPVQDCCPQEEKIFDQSLMSGMAGVSADGEYLWQIGINVVPEAAGKGLAGKLVRMMKEEVLRRGKVPFYGTSESHTISQTVGLKAGFVPAWTEVYVKEVSVK